MRDFRQLIVWQKSHAFVLAVYKATDPFPQRELYRLTDQLRRSAASVPTNIAEGCGRGGDAELGRFLTIAAGSASESEYHLILAKDLGYLPDAAYESLAQSIEEVKRMLSAFIAKTRSSGKSG